MTCFHNSNCTHLGSTKISFWPFKHSQYLRIIQGLHVVCTAFAKTFKLQKGGENVIEKEYNVLSGHTKNFIRFFENKKKQRRAKRNLILPHITAIREMK